MQYVNVPDPVESEARRQRILEGETHNLTAERADAMLAQALQMNNATTSNHAFYATLEITGDTVGVQTRDTTELIDPTPLIPPAQTKKRGRPPGKRQNPEKNITLRGTWSKKRNVQLIQNSPKIRKSYANQSKTSRTSRQLPTSQNVARPVRPEIPRPRQSQQLNRGEDEEVSSPTAPVAIAVTERNNINNQEATPSRRRNKADFQKPPPSLP
ncbi:hypothetical protein Rs2_46346 [Raphanus sativus]|nr:hypothetical protein Rs2_46346 [Raphanus sativus]